MIKQLYFKAGDIEKAEHAEKEAGKLGVLRGGTTGCVTATGEVVGQCHRKALVRYLGLQQQSGSNLWFDMGFANEELWVEKLSKSWEGKIRCEEDVPIQWELDGVQITGRPDIVLFDGEDKPVAGVELKAVGAINTASGIKFDDKPKLANLLQAAHYSSQLKIPFYLVYTCFAKGPLPYWAQKQYGEKELDPFIKEFKVWLDDGHILYSTEKGKEVDTGLTVEGIKDFYRLVIDMPKQKSLYNRFRDRDINGSPLPYNVCNYCPYNKACNEYGDNYEEWLDQIRLIKETSV